MIPIDLHGNIFERNIDIYLSKVFNKSHQIYLSRIGFCWLNF